MSNLYKVKNLFTFFLISWVSFCYEFEFLDEMDKIDHREFIKKVYKPLGYKRKKNFYRTIRKTKNLITPSFPIAETTGKVFGRGGEAYGGKSGSLSDGGDAYGGEAGRYTNGGNAYGGHGGRNGDYDGGKGGNGGRAIGGTGSRFSHGRNAFGGNGGNGGRGNYLSKAKGGKGGNGGSSFYGGRAGDGGDGGDAGFETFGKKPSFFRDSDNLNLHHQDYIEDCFDEIDCRENQDYIYTRNGRKYCDSFYDCE